MALRQFTCVAHRLQARFAAIVSPNNPKYVQKRQYITALLSGLELPLQGGYQEVLDCYIDTASVVVSIVLVLVICVWAWRILAHEVCPRRYIEGPHSLRHF